MKTAASDPADRATPYSQQYTIIIYFGIMFVNIKCKFSVKKVFFY